MILTIVICIVAFIVNVLLILGHSPFDRVKIQLCSAILFWLIVLLAAIIGTIICDDKTNSISLQSIACATANQAENSEVTDKSEDLMTFLGEFYCTGYTPSLSENGGYSTTYDGKRLWDVVDEAVAVDPSIIPIGKKIYIEGLGYKIARDTGGAIKGNRIDVLVSTLGETYNCTGNYKVYILN